MTPYLLFAALCLSAWAQAEPTPQPSSRRQMEDCDMPQSRCMHDPTVAAESLSRSFKVAEQNSTGSGSIKDPTQMTGSFTRALNRVGTRNPATGGGAANAPQIPEITLIAKTIRYHNKTVILEVDGKSHVAKEGNKFTVLDKGGWYEIQVDKIDAQRVEITLLPMGKKITL